MRISRHSLRSLILEIIKSTATDSETGGGKKESPPSLKNILKNEGVEFKLYAVWEGDKVVLISRFGGKVIRAEMNTAAFKGTSSEPKKLTKSQVTAVLNKKYGSPWWKKLKAHKPDVWMKQGQDVINAIQSKGTSLLNAKFKEGPKKSDGSGGSGGDGGVPNIVKKIEVALGVANPDGKWGDEVDPKWHAWVDKNKEKIKTKHKVDDAKIKSLRNSWAKFAREQKLKGSPAGMLKFITGIK